jgi:hypothetical protein
MLLQLNILKDNNTEYDIKLTTRIRIQTVWQPFGYDNNKHVLQHNGLQAVSY